MSMQFPSGTNTYLPSFDATGQLVVSFSRNPKDFALNQYVTITPVKKSSGYYLKLNAEQAARVSHDDLKDHVWHDGNDAPHGEYNNEKFEWLNFNTTRYVFPFRLGYKAVDQADWKIVASYSAINAQQAMTARTVRVLDKLLADSLDGHVVSMSDSSNPITSSASVGLHEGEPGDSGSDVTKVALLKKAFNHAAKRIHKDTLGVVGPKDLVVLINPDMADALSRSKEVHSYLKESPFALSQVRGDSESQNGKWGLPDQLYGYKIIVEDTVRVRFKKGGSKSSSDPAYVLPSDQILMLARPGDLIGFEGSPSYSTVHLFAYEEMTVEQKDDPDNRRINARIVEDYGVEVVAPVSAFKFTNVLV